MAVPVKNAGGGGFMQRSSGSKKSSMGDPPSDDSEDASIHSTRHVYSLAPETFPQISITGGIPTSLIPLTIVLCFDGVVTAIEDYRRHLDDDRSNRQKTLAARRQPDGSWAFEEVEWQDVSVGDVLKIRRGDTVAADCVFLRSKSSDGETPDRCYVMTAQLDGETNLKLRRAPKRVAQEIGKGGESVVRAQVAVECEQPTASFGSFTGTLWVRPRMLSAEQLEAEDEAGRGSEGAGTGPHCGCCAGCTAWCLGRKGRARFASRRYHASAPTAACASTTVAGVDSKAGSAGASAPPLSTSPPSSPQQHGVPLEADNLLLRGVQLRSVDHAYGLVVYTGRETKAQVKQGRAISKQPQTESALNGFILYLTLTLVILCTFGTVAYTIWIRHTSGESPHEYLDIDGYEVLDGIQKIGTFFLLNATIIPVSLYVSIRTARTLQMILMERDASMAYVDAEAVRAEERQQRAIENVKEQPESGVARPAEVPAGASHPEEKQEDSSDACSCPSSQFSSLLDCPCLHSIIGAPVPTGPGRYPLKVRSMDLNDELGQITHVFSDKTGTLTLNKMEFRSLMVGSVTYGVGSASLRKALAAAGQQLESPEDDAGSIRTADVTEDAASVRSKSHRSRDRGDEDDEDDEDDDGSTVAASQVGSKGARLLVAPHVRFKDGSKSHPGRSLEQDACRIRPSAPWWSGYNLEGSAGTGLTSGAADTVGNDGDESPLVGPGAPISKLPFAYMSPAERVGQDVDATCGYAAMASTRNMKGEGKAGLARHERGNCFGMSQQLPFSPLAGDEIHEMLLHLALNHSVVPEKASPPPGVELPVSAAGSLRPLRLSASSPDEEAFVYFAGRMGYALVDRRQDVVELEVVRPHVSSEVRVDSAFDQSKHGAAQFREALTGGAAGKLQSGGTQAVAACVSPAPPQLRQLGVVSESDGGLGGSPTAPSPVAEDEPQSTRRRSFGSITSSASGGVYTTQSSSCNPARKQPGEWLSYAGRLAAAVYGDGSPYSSNTPEQQWAVIKTFEEEPTPAGVLRRRLSYKLLHILPYNQMRKRMSVIVRHPCGRVSLYCKGADSVIMKRLKKLEGCGHGEAGDAGSGACSSPGDGPGDQTGYPAGRGAAEAARRAAETESQLSAWGADGLRTLVFACRSMDEEEVESFSERYQRALASLPDQAKRKAGLPNEIDRLMDEVEQGLSLQGATANEDKLQVGVPDTIATLARAGVRTWMLTGDKEETAVNIGYATRLLRPGMRVIHASTLSRTPLQGSRAVVALARESSRPAGRDDSDSGEGVSSQQTPQDCEGTGSVPRAASAQYTAADAASTKSGLDDELGVPRSMVPPEHPMVRKAEASASSRVIMKGRPPSGAQKDCTSVEIGGSRLQPSDGGSALSSCRAMGQESEIEDGKAESASGASVSSTGSTDGNSRDERSSSSPAPTLQPATKAEAATAGLSPLGQQRFQRRDRSGSGGSTPRAGTRPRKSTLASIFGQDGGESDEDGFNDESQHGDDMNMNNRGDLGVLLGDGLLETVGLAPQPQSPSRKQRPRSQSTAAGTLQAGAPAIGAAGEGTADASAAFASTPGRPEGGGFAIGKLGVGPIGRSVSAAVTGVPDRSLRFDGLGTPAIPLAPVDSAAIESSGSSSIDPQAVTLRPASPPHTGQDMQSRVDAAPLSPPRDGQSVGLPTNGTTQVGDIPSPGRYPNDGNAAPSGRESSRGPVAIVVDEAVIDVMLGSVDHSKTKSNGAADFAEVLLHPDDESMLIDPSERGQRWRARALAAALRRADAVICCRCRPDQKASLVKLIRDRVRRSRTLAIGDGANDVAMIREAHIGIGIAGREGMQAANAGDYAIGRFRLLKRLLLWHGRRNYIGMSKLVLFILWKNFLFVMSQFFYGLENGWSGQKFYIESGAQAFNLIYTSVPILLLATMDYDVSPRAVFRLPWLYREGQAGRHLNLSRLAGWVLMGLGEAAIIYFIVRSAYLIGGDYAQSPYIFQLGLLVLTSVIVLVNLRVAAEANSHTWLFQLTCALGVIFWIPALYVADAWDDNGMRGGASRFWASGAVLFTLPLVLMLSFLRTILWKFYKRLAAPELRHIAQEAEWVLDDVESLREELEFRFLSRGGALVDSGHHGAGKGVDGQEEDYDGYDGEEDVLGSVAKASVGDEDEVGSVHGEGVRAWLAAGEGTAPPRLGQHQLRSQSGGPRQGGIAGNRLADGESVSCQSVTSASLALRGMLSPGMSKASARHAQSGGQPNPHLARGRHRSRSFTSSTRPSISGALGAAAAQGAGTGGQPPALGKARTARQVERQLILRETLRGMDLEADPTETDSPFESPSLRPAEAPAASQRPSRSSSAGGDRPSREDAAPAPDLPPSRASMGPRSASFSGPGEAASLSLAERRARAVLNSSLSMSGAAGTTMTEDAGTAFFVSQHYSTSGLTSRLGEGRSGGRGRGAARAPSNEGDRAVAAAGTALGSIEEKTRNRGAGEDKH